MKSTIIHMAYVECPLIYRNDVGSVHCLSGPLPCV